MMNTAKLETALAALEALEGEPIDWRFHQTLRAAISVLKDLIREAKWES